MDAHENFYLHEVVQLPSNRSFWLVFTVFFAILGCVPLLKFAEPHGWALIISGVLLVISYALPSILTAPNRLWMKFGELMHRTVNPLVLGILELTLLD